MKTLLSYVSSLRQRAVAVFHRTDQMKGTDQVKADSAERRERWNQVMTEHRKPLDEKTGAGTINLPHP